MDVKSPSQWRWRLYDEHEQLVATHHVELDENSSEYKAFQDLDKYVRCNRLPHDPLGSETQIVEWIGQWIGSQVFGGLRLAGTVRVVLPVEAEFLLSRPLELGHINDEPLARRRVTLVYELVGAGHAIAKEPVADRLRLLAVFSLPTSTSALALRAERRGLTRTVQQIASRSDKAIELKVLQYGVTRERLRETAEEEPGWDVLHISSHSDRGLLILEKSDGTPDAVSTHELVNLLHPTRNRLKLAVLSSCNSGSGATSTTLRTLNLGEAADSMEAKAGTGAEAADANPMGLARGLVEHLSIGVLAMRYPVADPFAVALADELYPRLLGAGQPIDKALGLSVSPAAGAAPTVGRPALSLGTPALLVPPSAHIDVAPPPTQVSPDPYTDRLDGFPPEPERFVGRTQSLIDASAALAPDSGRTAVLFVGMAGAGKTACALELAHQHRGQFGTLIWWQAPSRPGQFAQALEGLAWTLDDRLAGALGEAMLNAIGSEDALRAFLPRLEAVLREKNVLLVLDNLETLLLDDQTWADPRLGLLIRALTGHGGRSRIVMTSRFAPAGLDTTHVLSIATHALSLSESVLLVRELPNLSRMLETKPATIDSPPVGGRELVRRVLRVVQGHPKLLELADAAAADQNSLKNCIAAAEAAGSEAPIAAFFATGTSSLMGSQFVEILNAWTATALKNLRTPSRVLMELLAGIEDDDRYSWLLGQIWPKLWSAEHLGTEPVSVIDAAAPLRAAALIDADAAAITDVDSTTPWRIHPGIAAAIRGAIPSGIRARIDDVAGDFLFDICRTGVIEVQRGSSVGSRVFIATGLASVPYLMRQRRWTDVCTMLDRATFWDSSLAVRQLALGYLAQLRSCDLNPTDRLMADVQYSIYLAEIDPSAAEPLLRNSIADTRVAGLLRLASGATGVLSDLLRTRGDVPEALRMADIEAELDRESDVCPWTQTYHRVRRLLCLAEMNRHDEVFKHGTALIEQLDDMDPIAGENERVIPWNVRENLLSVVSHAAMELAEWRCAADYLLQKLESQQARQAPEHVMTRALFDSYMPLIRLEEYAKAEQVLLSCQDSAMSIGDAEMLGVTYGARATLAGRLGQREEAMRLTEIALRYNYESRILVHAVTSHLQLAEFLDENRRQQEALNHRLAASVLCRASGRTERYSDSIQEVAAILYANGGQGIPADNNDLADRVENINGVRFRDVVGELTLDPSVTAELFNNTINDARSRARALREEKWTTSTLIVKKP